MTGLAMRYSDEDLKKLSQAALLHDIGKTMVNLNILNKPSRLTPDEYAMMKNHPEYGYELLKRSASFQPTVCASVYEHHENEDGSGNPGASQAAAFTSLPKSYTLRMSMKPAQPCGPTRSP